MKPSIKGLIHFDLTEVKAETYVGIGHKTENEKDLIKAASRLEHLEFSFHCGSHLIPISTIAGCMRLGKSIPCPCGNPKHWILKISKSD